MNLGKALPSMMPVSLSLIVNVYCEIINVANSTRSSHHNHADNSYYINGIGIEDLDIALEHP